MSAIKSIGNALRYDACEAALAAGASLSSVLDLAARTAPAYSEEHGPISEAPTVWAGLAMMRETVRPGKR